MYHNSSSGKDSFKFLTKYLATFSGEDAHIIGEAKEEAVRSIVEFVKASDMFQVFLSFFQYPIWALVGGTGQAMIVRDSMNENGVGS